MNCSKFKTQEFITKIQWLKGKKLCSWKYHRILKIENSSRRSWNSDQGIMEN
jgi:hypothetical protein